MNQVKIREIIELYGREKEYLLPVIKAVQKESRYNYVSQEEAQYISQEMEIKESEVYETVSFFAEFSEVPRGENLIKVCDSTVCRLNDNMELVKLLEERLSIKMGETTEDRKFSLEYSPCFGACDISPAVRINDEVYGNITTDKLKGILDRYRGGHNEENS